MIALICAIILHFTLIKSKNINYHKIFEYYSPQIMVESDKFPIFVADY